jgi:hypothetical protein
MCHRNFGAFPIEFESVRGWSPLIGSLLFIAVFIGCFLGGRCTVFNQNYYIARLRANNNRPVSEARLMPMMIGGNVTVATLFIFAWTSDPEICDCSIFPSNCLGCELTRLCGVDHGADSVCLFRAWKRITVGKMVQEVDIMMHHYTVSESSVHRRRRQSSIDSNSNASVLELRSR